jgi:DNA repair photolyase
VLSQSLLIYVTSLKQNLVIAQLKPILFIYTVPGVSMTNPADIIVNQRTLRKGRGALSNHGSRFQPNTSEWDEGTEAPSAVTECRAVNASSIISRNNSPDIPFYQSINPYQGCEHGCVYCYARPTHAYLDLSPGVDFETRLTYKKNAADQLSRELSKPNYQCKGITLGANTDPYQPVEREHRITRQLLEVLQLASHPVALITKGSLVTRDVDILAEMAQDGLASVAISVTTLDNDLKRTMEPRAASARARLDAMETLASAGVPVTLLLAPVIPALNDKEMEAIVESAANSGATRAAYMLLRLPLEIRDLFYEWLEQHYPLRAEHVTSLLRQSRGGKDYDSRFGHRMRGVGVFADLLSQRFALICKKTGMLLGEAPTDRTDLFDPSRLRPKELKNNSAQISLFD